MMGEEGVVPALGSGTIVVDSGNGDPRLSRKRFETCRDRGLQFLDAGVSGGRSGAMAGTLAIMVGGERDEHLIGPSRYSRRWANPSCTSVRTRIRPPRQGGE